MSAGLTPKEFVKQVFYQQEKVLLDFNYDDDKFQEVLMEGNFVLQELQKEEDWLWLRETMPVGILDFKESMPNFRRQEFPLDMEEIYKLSTLFGDCVHLYKHFPLPEDPTNEEIMDSIIYPSRINVPLISAGMDPHFPKREVSMISQPNVPDFSLGAHVVGDKLVFTRVPHWIENNRVVVVDYQRRLNLFPMLDQVNKHPLGEKLYDIPMLTEIPDPNYVVIKTAYYHAMGSPTAQGNISYLGDMSQKLLSSMRQNNAAATTSDTMEWYTPGFIEVI